MKIAIIGIGNVGKTLGELWVKKGHEIRYGLRKLDHPTMEELKKKHALKMHGRLVKNLLPYSDVLLLAVPGSAAIDALNEVENLENQIIIDCTNPIAPNMEELTIGTQTSQAEEIANKFPKTRVIKAFNLPGMSVVKDLNFNGIVADNYVAGDDEEAKKVVIELVKDIGFNPVDVGPLKQARFLEPMAMLWITLAYKFKKNDQLAFKLLKR